MNKTMRTTNQESSTQKRLQILIPLSKGWIGFAVLLSLSAISPNQIAQAQGYRVYKVYGRTVSRNVYEAALQVQEASKMIKENNIDLAAARFKKALLYDPTFPAAHTNLGIILARKGKNQEALQHLKKSTESKDCPPTGFLNLATFYQTTGDLENAINTFKLLLKKDLNDQSLKLQCESTLNMLEKESKRRMQNKTSEVQTDYLADVSGDSSGRWADWRMPLKVYVEPASAELESYRPVYDSLLKQSFIDWETASNRRFKFRFVKEKEDSDIDCFWTNNNEELGNGTENGNTKTSIRAGALAHASIALRCQETEGSFPMTENMIVTTSRHEIGHALGLSGHSVDPNDLMYFSVPLKDAAKEISTRDKNTALKVYAKPLPLSGQLLDLLGKENAKTVRPILFVIGLIAISIGVLERLRKKRKKKRK